MFNCTTVNDLLSGELVQKLSISYGTPLYVYFETIIRERARVVTGIFNGINIFPTFACKANNNPNLLRILKEEGFGTDIVTLGEYYASRLADIPDEKIVWNGNGKSLKEMALLSKVRYVNVDSIEELERWKDVAFKVGDIPELFLRINPNVNPNTHPYISTGLKKNKFGIPIEILESALKKAKESNLELVGFHIHIGSQITDVAPFYEALSQAVELSRKYGFRKINIGGGWGINYKDKELDLSDYSKTIVPLLEGFEEVVLEIGRYIIGPAGILILKVEYVKRTDAKTFIVVDGGMNVLIRPAMYGAFHGVRVLSAEQNEKVEVDVVGPLCESGDVLATHCMLEIPREGSYIVIENAGAYGYAMASNYNSTLKPAEVLMTENNEPKLIRRRETYDDLFRTII
ncbi:diaminopimelate decarboxylase [Fervidobacterium pennivorans]|uniref:diaminopimelate decarboxylase n=1 Tax=Fervidobacterium pennivorans TaxID=93466 RepID=UPI001436C85F|nr:diaminopimelate decarboxylase [Fervidobacterium pennivorans]QIV77891.1 diaminopimelate decarboxylase [Fervidobacterium pennivorans subsp. keratinolyticus]